MRTADAADAGGAVPAGAGTLSARLGSANCQEAGHVGGRPCASRVSVLRWGSEAELPVPELPTRSRGFHGVAKIFQALSTVLSTDYSLAAGVEGMKSADWRLTR